MYVSQWCTIFVYYLLFTQCARSLLFKFDAVRICERKHYRNSLLWHCIVYGINWILKIGAHRRKKTFERKFNENWCTKNDDDDNNRQRQQPQQQQRQRSNENEREKYVIAATALLLFGFFCLWQQFIINLVWFLPNHIIRWLFIVRSNTSSSQESKSVLVN